MAAFKTKRYWFMVNKIIFFVYLIILTGSPKVNAQIYYPEIEWLQTGVIAFSIDDQIQSDFLLFKQENFKTQNRSVMWGIQEFDENGKLEPFTNSNSISLGGSSLYDVFYSSLKQIRTMDSTTSVKILLNPKYWEDSLLVSRPVFFNYNIESKTIDTFSVHWNLENFGVYDALELDSFYYFKVAENRQSEQLKKYFIVKTDKQLNILVKYPFSGIMGNTARLHYWRGNIIIYGASRVYEPSLNLYIEFPAIYLHSPDDLRVFGKRVYKTKSPFISHDVWMVSLNNLNDNFMVGITGWASSDTYLLKIDTNFNMVDSTSYPQNSVIQYPTIKDKTLNILTSSQDGPSKRVHLNFISNSPFQNNFKTYDLGDIVVNTPFSLCKRGSKYLIYGNRWELDSSGTNQVSRMFRVVLDSNGVPLKSRGPASYVQPTIGPSQSFSIYPNPSSGFINIQHTLPNLFLSLEIKDMQGRIIHTQQITEQSVNLFLQASPGIYYVTLRNSIYSQTQKVLIVN
jgi:hypothetical protein